MFTRLRAHLPLDFARAIRLRRARDNVDNVHARCALRCSIQGFLVRMAVELHALLDVACIAVIQKKIEEEECFVRMCIYSILTCLGAGHCRSPRTEASAEASFADCGCTESFSVLSKWCISKFACSLCLLRSFQLAKLFRNLPVAIEFWLSCLTTQASPMMSQASLLGQQAHLSGATRCMHAPLRSGCLNDKRVTKRHTSSELHTQKARHGQTQVIARNCANIHMIVAPACSHTSP